MINKIINQNSTYIQAGQYDVNHNKIVAGHQYGLLINSDGNKGTLHVYEKLVGVLTNPTGNIIFIPLNSKFTTYNLDLFHDKIFDKSINRKRLKVTIK